jgi:uncharacterized phage-like protein YoqJ
MQKRNEYIVYNCDVLLFVYDLNESGGTAKCIEYARKVNKQIIIIEPKS